VLIVVQRTGNVTPPVPLFKDAVANTPVIVVSVAGVTVTEFNRASACNPDTVSDVVKTKKAENGAPEKGESPNIRIL